MPVRFLSDDWAESLTAAASEHAAFMAAAAGQHAIFQLSVPDSPTADIYHMEFSGDSFAVRIGAPAHTADINAKLDYDTNVTISRGQLTGQAAAMTGRMQVTGNIEKMMSLGKALDLLARVEENLDITY
ncbi:SCP2 sterol-binding domain-containing protein [Pseudonocardia acidicola]|uniref:SCP2 sterol-binding domain-containing protein n=1 Tax=Pseudonocardia acidicola TaxID=2724939 RepID=A0ABX1SIV0_9PSEU|nr:SCP2 sterol-binding domain-containing protein [Pseudonocardia acidicola]NMI00175.1 SCP2 sterol-binding domain-containing protein [Pseudonocardia acidicola]